MNAPKPPTARERAKSYSAGSALGPASLVETCYLAGFAEGIEAAIDAVSTRLNPPVNGEHAVVLMKACERIAALARKGEPREE